MVENKSIVGTIQARMGSTRLPGKMMLQLRRRPVVSHVVNRVAAASYIDSVVVATSNEKKDDIIDRYASNAGADIFRGDEDDVLGRMLGAASNANADIIVRISGDCPLISPDVIDQAVSKILETDADYVSNTINRSYPRGMDVEVFTMDSFKHVDEQATKSYEREHVTPYYYENNEEFEIEHIESSELFIKNKYIDRTDMRLTLDEADDYELLKETFRQFGNYDVPTLKTVIDYIDREGLSDLNSEVSQKTVG
jgi:spore coat polysaccharide biosynthesis protein SpsF